VRWCTLTLISRYTIREKNDDVCVYQRTVDYMPDLDSPGSFTPPDEMPSVSRIPDNLIVEETTNGGESPSDSDKFDGTSQEELLSSAASCLALFTAPWCGVDRMIRSIFAEISISESIEDMMIVDCNELPHLADRYRIDVFPTILLLERGAERGRKTGSISRSEILDLLRELRN